MNIVEKLKLELELTDSNSEKLKILFKLGNFNINRDLEDCTKYLSMAFDLPNIDEAAYFRILSTKVRNYVSNGDQESFYNCFNELTSFIENKKHLENEYTDWAVLNIERLNMLGKYDEANRFGESVLTEISDNVVKKWSLKKHLANSYNRTGNPSKVIEHFEHALELTSKHNLELSNADVLFDIAVFYAENNNLKNSKKYFTTALNKYIELNDIEYTIDSMSSLASVHSALEETDEAIKYYKQAIEKIHKHKFYRNYVHTLTNFGYFWLKQKNYKEYFKLEKEILDYVGDDFQLVSNTAYFFYHTNAKAYLEFGNIEKANYWIKKAEAEEASKNDLKAKVNISELKVALAKKTKKVDEIIENYENYINLKDELVNETKLKSIEEFEAKYQNKLKEKEKEILRLQKIEMEQKALRSQLNPHFFFNSLNSINKYIIENDSKNASKFLFKFSSLMRKTLENSEESFISVEEEVDYLKDYLAIEQLRLNFSFDFEIFIDEEIEEDFVKIPTMMLQPYVENCIKHGVNGIENGLIKIAFFLGEDDAVKCIVEDNGKGRNENSSQHKSMGTSILQNRIEALSKQYNLDFDVTTIDLLDDNKIKIGTKVELLIPKLDLI